jgi:hypothetical protein
MFNILEDRYKAMKVQQVEDEVVTGGAPLIGRDVGRVGTGVRASKCHCFNDTFVHTTVCLVNFLRPIHRHACTYISNSAVSQMQHRRKPKTSQDPSLLGSHTVMSSHLRLEVINAESDII